jgi:hypothetical protein
VPIDCLSDAVVLSTLRGATSHETPAPCRDCRVGKGK